MSDYKFYREDIGTWIDAGKKERWCWEALYTDGSSLKQFGDDGIYHQFREIDQSKLDRFVMWNENTYDFIPPITLKFKQGMKLIHFYNNYIFGFGSSGQRKMRVYCFGYEERGHKMIIHILPDDGMVITNGEEV